MEPRLVIIGGGAMARAIVAGAARSGGAELGPMVVCEPVAERRMWFDAGEAAGLGVRTESGISGAMAGADAFTQVLLAVKPQSLGDVARDLGPILASGPRRVVISILAGRGSAQVRAALGGQAAVVRAMPNLPASIGMGCSALCLGEGAQVGDEALALRLFGACGEVVRIDERLFDAFTALAGSGPAYVFYLAEAMERAGAAMGFDARMARSVTAFVLAGGGALLKATHEAPGELRESVTSKGGTTEAASRVLDDSGAMDALVRAIVAARDRGAELARGG